MSGKDLNWKYVERCVDEDAIILAARVRSTEFGITPVTAAQGSALAMVAASIGARSIVEIGTGVGVSALWLLNGTPDATLTTVDREPDFQQAARMSIQEAGHSLSRVRMISGDALEVLPRLNDAAYDLVVIDADPDRILEYAEHALRLARAGGSIAIPHALWRDRVADPAQRDERAIRFRALIKELSESEALLTALSPVGDGLLQVTKRP